MSFKRTNVSKVTLHIDDSHPFLSPIDGKGTLDSHRSIVAAFVNKNGEQKTIKRQRSTIKKMKIIKSNEQRQNNNNNSGQFESQYCNTSRKVPENAADVQQNLGKKLLKSHSVKSIQSQLSTSVTPGKKALNVSRSKRIVAADKIHPLTGKPLP